MAENDGGIDEAQDVTQQVDAFRVSVSEGVTREPCAVTVETPVQLDIESVGGYTLMSTSADLDALAAGFAFSEGIISGKDDIADLHVQDGPQPSISMRLRTAPHKSVGTERIITTSAGRAGSVDGQSSVDKVGNSLRASGSLLLRVLANMKTRQSIFEVTGGTHAAALFDQNGDIVSFAEDVGRHNALDKVIGKLLLSGRNANGLGVALSGRVSLEMASKAARAGIEIIAAVSAPTSLAVGLAKESNVTLCGFVRKDRATVFSHPHRINDLD